MAISAVQRHGISVAVACRTFSISQTSYRYVRIFSDENERIADWLMTLPRQGTPGALACVDLNIPVPGNNPRKLDKQVLSPGFLRIDDIGQYIDAAISAAGILKRN